MDQKGLIVDSYCFIAIVLFAISIWSVKVRPSCPELICVSHCCCFFCFCLCHLPLLNWPSTQTDSEFSLCLFLVLFVCLFLISVCAAHLSWAGLLQQVTLCLVALFLFNMLFVYLYFVSVPTCPELVCECDPMLWLLSSRRTLSNVGILPFDLHTFDVYVEIEFSPSGALHEHW